MLIQNIQDLDIEGMLVNCNKKEALINHLMVIHCFYTHVHAPFPMSHCCSTHPETGYFLHVLKRGRHRDSFLNTNSVSLLKVSLLSPCPHEMLPWGAIDGKSALSLIRCQTM